MYCRDLTTYCEAFAKINEASKKYCEILQKD